MPYYLLSVVQTEGEPHPPAVQAQIGCDNDALVAELRAARVWVFGGRLHAPSTATVVRTEGDELLVTDGPFAEGKEHLGGMLVIDVPDLDAAPGWARKQARASRTPIEVRPFHSAGER